MTFDPNEEFNTKWYGRKLVCTLIAVGAGCLAVEIVAAVASLVGC